MEKQYEQDPAFYVWDNGWETVWTDSTLSQPRFSVVRNGDMEISIRNSPNDEWATLRYTPDLIAWGINTDAELWDWAMRGSDVFLFERNPWFEVWDNSLCPDADFVFHHFDVAVAYAQELWNNYGQHGKVE